MRNTQLLGIGIAIVLIAGTVFFAFSTEKNVGSVVQGSEYSATSTAPSSAYGATITGSALVKNGPGQLGQITITGAGTGVVNIYNATTTNVSARLGQVATSSILLASFPASTAAGTYIFDVPFTYGLYVDVVSGAIPTSTISYR